METFDFYFFTLTAEQLMTCLKTLQLAGIFIPVVSVVVILQKEQSKGATYLMLANAACSIVNCAYLMILETDNSQALTTAYRMEYVGISLFFFFFILFNRRTVYRYFRNHFSSGQGCTYSIINCIVNFLFSRKSYLSFCRVHINIQIVPLHFHTKRNKWKFMLHQKA